MSGLSFLEPSVTVEHEGHGLPDCAEHDGVNWHDGVDADEKLVPEISSRSDCSGRRVCGAGANDVLPGNVVGTGIGSQKHCGRQGAFTFWHRGQIHAYIVVW